MSPTILRVGAFRVFFLSREESRAPVHVHSPDGEAKSWLEPEVECAMTRGLSERSLADARRIVEGHREEFRDAWKHHFGS